MDEYKAWFTVQCWGCNKSETRGYHDQKDVDYQMDLLKLKGWQRRTFGNCPSASPWFCSEDCATNSYNARRAEEWWAAKEWRKKEPMVRLGMLMGFGAFVLISLYCALFLGWCN